jgi:glycosyltransferase involved in cell wall biosynthesis
VPADRVAVVYSGVDPRFTPQSAAALAAARGFGLPVLEAMACGTPVVCSNLTALPEVAGGAALLVNPYEPEAIADAILQLARDTAWQARLRDAGFARAAGFRWEESARTTWHLLEEAAA